MSSLTMQPRRIRVLRLVLVAALTALVVAPTAVAARAWLDTRQTAQVRELPPAATIRVSTARTEYSSGQSIHGEVTFVADSSRSLSRVHVFVLPSVDGMRQEVVRFAVPVPSQAQAAGVAATFPFDWDGRDAGGQIVPVGAYDIYVETFIERGQGDARPPFARGRTTVRIRGQ